MTISPTLGISPGDTRPIMDYADHASQSLQQLGAQIQADMTQVATNQQLKGLSQTLGQLDPSDERFPQVMAQAVTQFPLAAHTPVGIAAINELGATHRQIIQDKMLGEKLQSQEGIAADRDASRERIAGVKAQSVLDAAGKRADSSNYSTDQRVATANMLEDGRNQRFQDQMEFQKANTQEKLDAAMERVQKRIDADNQKYGSNVPKDVAEERKTSWNNLQKAISQNHVAEQIYNSNPNDKNAGQTYRNTQSMKNDAQLRFNNADSNYQFHAAKSHPAFSNSVQGLSNPPLPAPDESTPTAPIDQLPGAKANQYSEPAGPPAPKTQQAMTPAERQQSLSAAKEVLSKNPKQRAGIIDKLRKAGFTDDEMLNAQL